MGPQSYLSRNFDRKLLSLLIALTLVAAPLGLWVSQAHASGLAQTDITLVVTSSADGGDNNWGDGVCNDGTGACTLRAAIEEANALAGRQTINFNIRGAGNSCPALVTFKPATTLELIDEAGVVIDGYSQCDARPNDQPVAGNAVIKIEIQGQKALDSIGLWVHSANNVVKGLALYDWEVQIYVSGSTTTGNIIQGNFIGTNAANTVLTRFTGASGEGIQFDHDGFGNTIGGPLPQDRNIISGSAGDGIGLLGEKASNNLIIGNYVGLAQDGSTPLPNGSDGIDLGQSASGNIVGGLNPGERNVVSGNSADGIEISEPGQEAGNQIVGNLIGVNASGTASVPNGVAGVTIEEGVRLSLITRNVIAGNGGVGIFLDNSFENVLSENFIGVVPPGLPLTGPVPAPASVPDSNLIAMGNGGKNDPSLGMHGVHILGGSQNNDVLGNIVAYNRHTGVLVDADQGFNPAATCDTNFNTISENRIFQNSGLGIRLRPDNCGADPTIYNPNQGIQPPVITDAATHLITGTACNNCTVELFLSDKTSVSDPEKAGEGKLLVGKGKANNSGQFSISVSGLVAGHIVTGTATDSKGNTSEFALNALVRQGEITQDQIFLPLVRK